ncbi:hypothetical protein FHU38_004911 [Saccharomonospora amisosensis]|uniref:DUF485 domain-containing protein n=1 Tax=Saccharomonospora amisosensis TaxID=1128677 RepID=A0A7X5UUS8_9PSEU|nr:hypothetical protein [Saccharomonospora amisosensis]NIJ14510.1 hypothetical protein [Saccharomonospora amisosensis]
MTDEVYRKIDGIREPDPTLGRSVPSRQQTSRPAIPIPSDGDPATLRARRQRVVLAEPSRSPGGLRARVELAQQTSWGELLISDLIKAQLRSGVLLAVLAAFVLGALPLAFYFSPTLATLRFIGLPVPWLLLGIAPFPFLLGVGLWYNRLAERHERDFVNMIEN